jgi:hypothetical protein
MGNVALAQCSGIALARRGPVWDSDRTNRSAPIKWANIKDLWYKCSNLLREC